MFYGLGEMTDAMEKGREKRNSKRLENARLYNEFVKSNPGATTQERLDFANNLIKTTGAGSAGLPTKAQMEQNYEKYQAEQRRAAAARAQAARRAELAARRQAMQDANNVATFLAPSFGSEGFEGMVTEQAEAFGIPEAFIPGITQRAGDQAYQDWAKNNQVAINAYLSNPTRAGYEVLSTAPGASNFTGRLSGAYEGAYKAAEANQVTELNNQLLDLAQTSNLEDYEKARANLLRGVPSAVTEQLDLSTYDETVSRRQQESQTAASQNALAQYTSFLRQQGSNITGDVAEAKMSELIATASANGITLTEADFAQANTLLNENLQQADLIQQSGIANAIRSADGLLAEVLDGSKTEDQAFANLQSGALSQVKPGYQMSEQDKAAFRQALEQLRLRRAEGTGRAADAAVLGADVSDVARGNEAIADVRTQLETQLSSELGYTVTLSDENVEALRGQIEDAKAKLSRELENSATVAVNSSEVIESTSNETREQFVEQFIAQVANQQGVNSDDTALRGQLEALANSTYDRIFIEIRSQANEAEDVSIATALREIRTPSLPDDDTLGEVRDAIGASIETTSMLGDGTDEDQVDSGMLKQTLVTNVSPKIAFVAAQYGIPLTPELASMVMEQYKAANLSVNGMTNYVPGQEIDQSSITSAFEAVLGDYMSRASSGDLPHGALRLQALNEAMSVSGVSSLSNMTSEQRREFDASYSSAVERLVNNKYDILADTELADLEPTQAVVQSTSEILDTSVQAIREFSGFVSSRDLGQQDVAAYDAALSAKTAMEGSIPDINNEIARLSRLMANDIYKPNPGRRAEIQRQITLLQDGRNSIQGLIRQYEADYQRLLIAKAENDAALARAAEVAETEAQQRRMEAAQVELANTPPGPRGRMPSGLSPEAQELWKERQRLQIEENNAWLTNIFGGGEVSRGRNGGRSGR